MKRVALAVAAGCWLYLPLGVAQPAAGQAAAPLPTVVVKPGGSQSQASYEGTVEAVRQATLAAQVPGTVVELAVKAGQPVQAGQVLLRIDGRAAEQANAASRAQLDVAAKDLERKRQLYSKQYISKAALEQAEAAYKAAAAQATLAQTQSGFHVVRAPYAGVVSQVVVEQGEMAMPGKPLLTLYDPASLRVTAAVPASVARQASLQLLQVEVPDLAGGAAGGRIAPLRVELLPAIDPHSLTQPLRALLPGGTHAVPGMFARVWLQAQGDAAAGGAGMAAGASGQAGGIRIPLAAVVRRAEMTGVYVLDGQSRPLLRQVRLGRASGDAVEVLAGLDQGERVVTTPQAAARAQ